MNYYNVKYKHIHIIPRLKRVHSVSIIPCANKNQKMSKIINLFPDISHTSSIRIVNDMVQIYGHTVSSTEYIINGIDDTIYEKNRDIWETIPRGNGVYFVDNIPVANITGLRKFGYSDSSYGYSNNVNTVVLVD